MRIMALPTDVTRPVRIEVDAADFGRAGGSRGMALPAESACRRLGGNAGSRLRLVTLVDLVTLRALQRCVSGESLGAGDLAVAGTAFLRHLRRLWSVGIVTLDAGRAGVVADRINLREAGGPRRIVAVAEWAITPVARGGWFVFGGGFNMCRSSTVADFAGQRLVACGDEFFGLLGVADSAKFPTRIDYGE